MKYSQLVKKRVVLAAALLGLTCLTGQSIKALSPQEIEAKNYFISFLGPKAPNVSWTVFCDKLISLLKATGNPRYQPLIDALTNARCSKNPQTITNMLRRDTIINSLPEEVRNEIKPKMDYKQICKNIACALYLN